MTGLWLAGLVRNRSGRLVMTAAGIALAVALLATLGSFLATSQATMTARVVRSVPVAWQVEVQPPGDPATVLAAVQAAADITVAVPVGVSRTTGFAATTGVADQRTTQQTGPGVILGMPDGYGEDFPGEIRLLAGAATGVLIAQQTAANLHVVPGDNVEVQLPGGHSGNISIDGVVDLPQANSLFQKVGAGPGAQPVAPPDNVILLPRAQFDNLTAPALALDPSAVVTQIHAGRAAPASPDPAVAFTQVTAAARNLEVTLAGAALVGDNLGASLDAARSDSRYAQILFLFLAGPGVVLATVLTVVVAGAGSDRRRREQALLRTRGLRPAQVIGLAAVEAGAVGIAGAALGLAAAAVIGRVAFGSASLGASPLSAVAWAAAAALTGLAVAALAVLLPTVRDLRSTSVMAARSTGRGARLPLWARLGVDIVVLAISALVFWSVARTKYTLVLAPEGVPTISVNYWAFLGPILLWLGSAMLLWRVCELLLRRGVGPIRSLIRPIAGPLSATSVASMSRRRITLARSVVLLALAVSFAVSTATFTATYRQQAEADALLTNGADVTVTQAAPTATDGTGSLTAIPGVRAVEPLQHRFAYVGADLQDLYGVRPSTIVDATALADAYFSGGTARELMAQLAANPDSVLVSQETITDFQLSPGDLINLRLQDATTQEYIEVPFHVVGVGKEFPTAPSDSFLIANADYIASATGNPAIGTYLIDTGGRNQAAVADQVRSVLGQDVTVTDITQARSHVGSSLTSVDLGGLSRLELGFAVVIAAAAGGLVLALDLAERRRTFALTRVLGATSRQLRGLVSSETAVVTVFGLVGGAVAGWALSRMLVAVLNGVFDPPPSTIAVPW